MAFKQPIAIIRELPKGGLGVVYVCRDAAGREFAAKFPKDHSDSSALLVADEERRFARHQGQHVVDYYGPIELTDGRRGFAMELMEGSLSDLISKSGALPIGTAVEYFAHAVAGLREVHQSAVGAFHGDLKLANILYKNEKAKLADFGLARGGIGQTRMLGPHQWGTLGYFPPEEHASPEGDVYSMGVTLWAMLAGREPRPHGPDGRLQIAGRLGNLLHSMLARDPVTRPAMATVLEEVGYVRVELGLARNDDWFGDLLKLALGTAAVFGIIALLAKKA